LGYCIGNLIKHNNQPIFGLFFYRKKCRALEIGIRLFKVMRYFRERKREFAILQQINLTKYELYALVLP
jgi:hypothetical protein